MSNRLSKIGIVYPVTESVPWFQALTIRFLVKFVTEKSIFDYPFSQLMVKC